MSRASAPETCVARGRSAFSGSSVPSTLIATPVFRRTPKYTGPERRQRPRWRPRPLRVLLLLLALAGAGYLAGVLWLVTQETRLVFQAVRILGDNRPRFAYQQIDLPRPDGARQFAWLIPAPQSGRAWVIYLHGNPSTIASPVNISHYALLREAGLNVLAPEYRGFGGLGGTLTEAGVAADARAAYTYLRDARGVPPARILLYGWSLGSAIAIALAAEIPAAGVILEGAPASMADLNQLRYPLFPMRALMRHAFDSIGTIGRVAAPLLFLHSPSDQVVPIAEGRRLYAAAPEPKLFVEVPGGHMQASEAGAAVMSAAIRRFIPHTGSDH